MIHLYIQISSGYIGHDYQVVTYEMSGSLCEIYILRYFYVFFVI